MATNQVEWIVGVLNDSSDTKLSNDFVDFIYSNAEKYNLSVIASDCICDNLNRIRKYTDEEVTYYQESKIYTTRIGIDKFKEALILVPYNVMGKMLHYVIWYKPKEKNPPKTVTIYGVVVVDDELHYSTKAYCLNRELALREANKYCDWYSDIPVGEKGIVKLELVVE